jgi:hypothetical protein
VEAIWCFSRKIDRSRRSRMKSLVFGTGRMIRKSEEFDCNVQTINLGVLKAWRKDFNDSRSSRDL